MILTQKRLKALLHYNPETGIFTRLVRTTNSLKIGDVAGGDSGNGYIQIRVGGGLYWAHRLAWLYMTGKWPRLHIDHENGNGMDNRFHNLRDKDRSFNMQNRRRARVDNSCGFLGVQTNNSGFQARITVKGKRISLGTYSNPAKAHEIYLSAKRKLHEGCSI